MGKNPQEHKEFEGDSKTPEGLYYIDSKNPKSRYFLNLGISYPNKLDIANAKNTIKMRVAISRFTDYQMA